MYDSLWPAWVRASTLELKGGFGGLAVVKQSKVTRTIVLLSLNIATVSVAWMVL